MIATAILGLLVALPSRRLVGDYLAIVTLFFGQLFVTVVNNGNRISFLGLTRGYDLTGGPNGIADIDPFHLFGRYARARSRATSTSRSSSSSSCSSRVYLVDAVAHRPRLAVAARGPARGRADGHARSTG